MQFLEFFEFLTLKLTLSNSDLSIIVFGILFCVRLVLSSILLGELLFLILSSLLFKN